MMGDSLTQFTMCFEHNLPKDVFIKPDKSQPHYQKQVCRQCAFEFYEIIPAKLVKDKNQPLIEQFQSQVSSNSIKMNQVIKQLISIQDLINKQIENLIKETRNQIQNQDELLKQCKTNILQKEVIQQLHQKYLEYQTSFQKSSIQQIQITKSNHGYGYDQIIQLLGEMNLNILNEEETQLNSDFCLKQQKTSNIGHQYDHQEDEELLMKSSKLSYLTTPINYLRPNMIPMPKPIQPNQPIQPIQPIQPNQPIFPIQPMQPNQLQPQKSHQPKEQIVSNSHKQLLKFDQPLPIPSSLSQQPNIQISKNKMKIRENKQPSGQNQIILQDNQIKLKRFEYQLLPKSTMYDARINGIAFNEDTSVVVAIFTCFIKVYKFQNEKLKQIQHIENHFLESFYQIHEKGLNLDDQQWIFTDQIDANGEVNCLIVNSNSDQIIFAKKIGTMDTYSIIIFCKLNNNNKWEQYQQIETSDCVYSLSLNDSNTKLISAQRYSKIYVYEYDESEWLKVQLIIVDDYGMKICFISDSEFVFLPLCSENLCLFRFNNQSKKFEKVNQFQIKGGGGRQDIERFSIQFIKSINLLLVQNCNFINIIRKEDSIFILDQSIEFKSYKMVGCISENGQYLLTQDEDSNELLVRKLLMIQQ